MYHIPCFIVTQSFVFKYILLLDSNFFFRVASIHLFVIKCEFSVGKPTPIVAWYRDDLPITAETFQTPERRNIRSEITLGPLGRQDLNTRLSCKAINHPRATPLESTVQIDMNCKSWIFY